MGELADLREFNLHLIDRADRAGDKRPTFTTIASLLQNRVLSCV